MLRLQRDKLKLPPGFPHDETAYQEIAGEWALCKNTGTTSDSLTFTLSHLQAHGEWQLRAIDRWDSRFSPTFKLRKGRALVWRFTRREAITAVRLMCGDTGQIINLGTFESEWKCCTPIISASEVAWATLQRRTDRTRIVALWNDQMQILSTVTIETDCDMLVCDVRESRLRFCVDPRLIQQFEYLIKSKNPNPWQTVCSEEREPAISLSRWMGNRYSSGACLFDGWWTWTKRGGLPWIATHPSGTKFEIAPEDSSDLNDFRLDTDDPDTFWCLDGIHLVRYRVRRYLPTLTELTSAAYARSCLARLPDATCRASFVDRLNIALGKPVSCQNQ
jgi:hypothetical protein